MSQESRRLIRLGLKGGEFRNVKGMRGTAEAIEKLVGTAGIDYLVRCRGNIRIEFDIIIHPFPGDVSEWYANGYSHRERGWVRAFSSLGYQYQDS